MLVCATERPIISPRQATRVNPNLSSEVLRRLTRFTMTPAIEADWILKVMAAMAAADQRLDAREVTLIQQVYEELTGEPVDVSGVMSAVQVYARKDIVEELSEVVGSLTPETKSAILRGACQTVIANDNVSRAERNTLEGLAAVLQLTDVELETVLARVDDA